MRLALAGSLSTLALALGAATASAATAVSSNWSGYAVSGTTFSSVSGTWVQPAADCSSTTGETTASAFWVGLGGDSSTSTALEQTGTESDCHANGTATYSAWYELVPKAAVKANLKVSAGDKISATVTVDGTSVTMKLTNLTTKATFSKTLQMSVPDVSSAEWIAEAPSALTQGGTTILPLTDFGTVAFTNASATSTSGHTGSISDSAWTATRIALQSQSGGGPGGPGFGGPGPQFASYDPSVTTAIPSALRSSGKAFSVTVHQTAQSTGI
jgi:hypothetical protein